MLQLNARMQSCLGHQLLVKMPALYMYGMLHAYAHISFANTLLAACSTCVPYGSNPGIRQQCSGNVNVCHEKIAFRIARGWLPDMQGIEKLEIVLGLS